MICTQIIDLFIPTGGPNVLADKFNGIKGFRKHGSIPTQTAIWQSLIDETKVNAGKYEPFSKIGPNMHADRLQSLPHRLFLIISHGFPARRTPRPRSKTCNWVSCRGVFFKWWRHRDRNRRWNQTSFDHFLFDFFWTRRSDCCWLSKGSNEFNEKIVHYRPIYLSYRRICESRKGCWTGSLKWWSGSHGKYRTRTKCDSAWLVGSFWPQPPGPPLVLASWHWLLKSSLLSILCQREKWSIRNVSTICFLSFKTSNIYHGPGQDGSTFWSSFFPWDHAWI